MCVLRTPLSVGGTLFSNTKRTLSPVTAMMNLRFSGRKTERLRRRSQGGVEAAAVLLSLLLPLLILGVSHLEHRVTCLLSDVGGLFVANTSQPAGDKVSVEVTDQLPAPVLPVASSPTSEEIVPTPGPETRQQPCPAENDLLKDEYMHFDFDKFTHDIHEYEQGQKSIIVRHRLRENIDFWRSIGASEFILDVIDTGYKLPLVTKPSRLFCRNNRSALNNASFVSEAIQDLLDRSLVVKCKDPPHVVNPLTVSVQNSGKKRLILDLREVNKHLWKQPVKYEDIKVALSFMEKGCYQIKFDLTSAYHFVDIFDEHTQFLGFAWPDGKGSLTYLKFLVLPFGISSACYLFTKLTRPLVNKWRGEGKLVTMFLDDGYGCAKGLESTEILSREVKNDLIASGFVPNKTKCIWIPVQLLEFLGAVLDSLNGKIFIPERRVQKVFSTIDSILESIKVHRRVKVRSVASIVGQLISMSVVIGHISQIMSRSLSTDVLLAHHWDQYIALSDQSIRQLHFWKLHLESINAKDIFESHKSTKICYSDASSTGYAGFEVSTINGVSHGMWNEKEAQQSSTWRELVAVYRVLLSLVHILKNQRVKWFTDNQGTRSIVMKGSMKEDLQAVAYSIFVLCMENAISLEIEWIPRTENEKADYLSRIVDFDDWGISSDILFLLQREFGNFEVDWFASDYNAKLPVFYSRFWNPSCTGIDAFAEYWGDKFGLFVPPISIIHRVLRKMRTDRAKGLLVVPYWKSAIFWPLLCPDGHFIGEVEQIIDIPTQKEFYVRCKNGKGIFGNVDLNFRMLAIKLCFQR
jgi:hypothetical protein